MKYIAVYDKNETDYKTHRLGFLQNAKDVHIKQSINGDYTMEFKLPRGDEKWGLIGVENKVGYDGKVFRIKEINGTEVFAASLIQDSCRTHIQYIGDMIGKPANEIFEAIFSTTPYVTVLSTEELEALGLEPVTDKIDFFELSKKTPIGCMNILLERLNKYCIHSEVYIDNNKIGLVRQLGADRGVVVDPKFNANNVKPNITTYRLVTKLYPYGRDDLPLDQSYKMHADGTLEPLGVTNNGRGYILSPNYELLGEYEGFCNFDEITEPEDLKFAAAHQFSADNIDRVDVPKYSVPFKFLDVKANEKVKLGDTVTAKDRDNGITSKQRVTTVDTYPLEPNRSTFEAGNPSVTMQEAMTTSFAASQYLRINKRNDELKTTAIENYSHNLKTEYNSQMSNDSKKHEVRSTVHNYGDIWVDPKDPNKALSICDGVFAIANGRKVNGDYNWTAFGDATGFTANKIVAGTIQTELVKLMGEGAKLSIKNNIIEFRDEAQQGEEEGKLRARWGYDGEKYVFEMYGPNGKRNMYIDDNGNLTMCGVFKTGENGEARIEIDKNGINSYNTSNRLDGLVMNPGGFWSGLSLYRNGNKTFTIEIDRAAGASYLVQGEKTVVSMGRNTHYLLGGTWDYGGAEIANKADIAALQAQIDNLKKTNANPII